MRRKVAAVLLGCMLVGIMTTVGLTEESIKPTPRIWKGDNFGFFISEDGAKITHINSPLEEGCSIYGIKNSGSFDFKLHSEILIINGIIDYRMEMGKVLIEVKGEFKSANFASGEATLVMIINLVR